MENLTKRNRIDGRQAAKLRPPTIIDKMEVSQQVKWAHLTYHIQLYGKWISHLPGNCLETGNLAVFKSYKPDCQLISNNCENN